MSDFHPVVEKVLALMGISSTQVRWRYYRQLDEVKCRFAALRQPRARFKFCRHCGHLAKAEESMCPQCQRALPSYLGSKVHRFFALNHFSAVSMGFLGTICALFCVLLGVTEFRGLFAPTGADLVAFGAFSTELWRGGELWRVFTMGLMHIGILHLVFNLGALSQVLPVFENDIGPWPTLVLVTTTQLGAVGAHGLLNHPATLTAGASGIAFGLIGFGVAYFHRLRNREARSFFLKWFAFGLLFGFMMRANNAAHMGGFLMGLPLGYLLARSPLKHQRIWRLAGILCLALWGISLAFLLRSVVMQAGILRERQAGRPSCPDIQSRKTFMVEYPE